MAILDILTLGILFLFILGSILGFGWAAKKLGLWDEDHPQTAVVPPMIDPAVYKDVAIIVAEAINSLGANGVRPIYNPMQIVDPRCTSCRLKNGTVAAVFRLRCDTDKLPRASVFQHRLQDEVDASTAWSSLPSLVVHATYQPHKGGVIIQVAARADLCRGINI